MTSAMEPAGEPKRFVIGASAGCRRVEVEGVSIAYDDRGSGFPIVGLHAVSHGSRDFEGVADALARRWRFITLDWPGHGRSGPDTKPIALARCTAILAGFMDALKIDRAVFIGNSIGGSAAMDYASKFPARAAGLVLVNPGGLRAMNSFGRVFCGWMAALGRAGQRGSFYYRPITAMLYRQYLRTPASRAQRDRIVDGAAETAAISEQAWLSFRTPPADQTAVGPTILCPVLFAWGAKDPVVAFSGSKDAIARFPNHQVSLFQCGHCPFIEMPEEFVSAVTPFIEKAAAGRRASSAQNVAAR